MPRPYDTEYANSDTKQETTNLPSTPSTFSGLTSAQVRERMARGESNNFKARVGRSYWDIVRDNLLNLFNIIMFTLLFVVLLFRDYATVLFAGFSVVTNSFLGMIQEISAKRKLDSLAALAAHEVRVYRDGGLTTIPIRAIVKDDVLPLEPGDRLVVDGRVLYSDALEMDESQLTGESDAVMKNEGDNVFSGSFCIAGSGVMVATQIGRNSTINRLSSVAKIYKNVQTPTQQKIAIFVQISVIVMLICVPMIFISGAIYQLVPLEMFRNAVVFVASLVPQGLVLTAILSLTIGAITISRYQTLIQRVNAVESMANVTVLCFDKTGTLTRNQLRVAEIVPLTDATQDHICAKLHTYTSNLAHLNSTAAAVQEYTRSANGAQALPAVTKIYEVPFTSARKWGAIVLSDETLILGAPERVLSLERRDHERITQQAEELAAQGYRVLALAHSVKPPTDGQLDGGREPLALVVLSDTVRDDIHETLDAFREQNVALKVISGDNLQTVKAIAGQAGLPTEHVYTGDQLERMDAEAFDRAALDGDVFARVEPETKRKLIAALKRHGHYVAMVGDGVNDVPALKEAHLAVVMNDGAQISKDVGEIVLLNNAMSTLPLAFKRGKVITQIIYGTTKIFLVKNFYSVLFFLFAGFMAMPFPISPIQISWLTFGVINVPATLIAFNVLTPTYMQRFRRDVLDYVVTAGVIGATCAALVYAVTYLGHDFDLLLARTAVTIFLIFYGVNTFWNIHGVELLELKTVGAKPGIFALGIALGAFTLVVPYASPLIVPELAQVFTMAAPPPVVWVLVVAVSALSIVVLGIAMRTRALVSRLWALFAP